MLCYIMSGITSLLFVTQNVIEHNRDLLDESYCDVMKQKFMCVRCHKKRTKKNSAYGHFINDVIKMIDDEI